MCDCFFVKVRYRFIEKEEGIEMNSKCKIEFIKFNFFKSVIEAEALKVKSIYSNFRPLEKGLNPSWMKL